MHFHFILLVLDVRGNNVMTENIDNLAEKSMIRLNKNIVSILLFGDGLILSAIRFGVGTSSKGHILLFIDGAFGGNLFIMVSKKKK